MSSQSSHLLRFKPRLIAQCAKPQYKPKLSLRLSSFLLQCAQTDRLAKAWQHRVDTANDVQVYQQARHLFVKLDDWFLGIEILLQTMLEYLIEWGAECSKCQRRS